MYYFCIKNFLKLLFGFLINFTGGRTDCFNLRFSKSETNDTMHYFDFNGLYASIG